VFVGFFLLVPLKFCDTDPADMETDPPTDPTPAEETPTEDTAAASDGGE